VVSFVSVSSEVGVHGMKEISAKLKTLPLNLKEKVAAGSMLRAARVGVKSVQQEAPKLTGVLRRHIWAARRKRDVPWNLVQYVVFVKAKVRPGKKNQAQQSEDAYYWYFVEFGHSSKAGNPFMERGFGRSVNEALSVARDYAEQQTLRGVLTQEMTGTGFQ
jgi:HK97 gp10 family phage protein